MEGYTQNLYYEAAGPVLVFVSSPWTAYSYVRLMPPS
jgi:hypothetical protein